MNPLGKSPPGGGIGGISGGGTTGGGTTGGGTTGGGTTGGGTTGGGAGIPGAVASDGLRRDSRAPPTSATGIIFVKLNPVERLRVFFLANLFPRCFKTYSFLSR